MIEGSWRFCWRRVSFHRSASWNHLSQPSFTRPEWQVVRMLWPTEKIPAKLENTPQLICISLNKKSVYCVMPCSTKHFDTCKWTFHPRLLFFPELAFLRLKHMIVDGFDDVTFSYFIGSESRPNSVVCYEILFCNTTRGYRTIPKLLSIYLSIYLPVRQPLWGGYYTPKIINEVDHVVESKARHA